MSKFLSNVNQDVSVKSYQSDNVAKKTNLEKVSQTLLGCGTNSTNRVGHSFSNFCKMTSLIDENVLQEYMNVAVTGLKFFELYSSNCNFFLQKVNAFVHQRCFNEMLYTNKIIKHTYSGLSVYIVIVPLKKLKNASCNIRFVFSSYYHNINT